MGDSITQGNYAYQSYRYPFWKKLVTAGLAFDKVGSLNSNEGGNPVWPDFNGQTFDRDHEGHWGWRADQILASLDGWLNGYTPDVVLLHIGSNDLYQGQDINSTINETGQIIDRLRIKNPNVRVLIAKLIPTTLSFNAGVNQLNAKIDALAESKDSIQSPVRVVDQNTGFNAQTDTADGVHPNVTGEEKMAQRWIDSLQALIGTPPDQAAMPSISPNGGTHVGSVQVTLSTATLGAFMRYTLNGTEPSSTNGIVYTGPFFLGSNATLKAVAYMSGVSNSPVSSAAFTVNPAPSGTFVRGINLGGAAVTIEGNAWASHAAALNSGFSSTGATVFTATYSFPLNPAADPDTTAMLQSLLCRPGQNVSFRMAQTIPNGPYWVYLWFVENYQDNFRSINVALEGAIAASNICQLPRGDWRKYGPYPTTVADGELTVDIISNNSVDPLVCGLAIFTPPSAPEQRINAGLMDGKIVLDWSGSGQLQEASGLTGPWSNVLPAPSPPVQINIITNQNRFFRLMTSP